jgi:FkbM family methyltransferase
MTKSDIAQRLAIRLPALAKGVLWLWARGHAWLTGDSEAPEHWFFSHLANALGYRVPVLTKLGNGMKIHVASNDFVGGMILRDGYYESGTVSLIERLLAPGMVFLDVGAHVGQYTLVASRQVGGNGQVHSFEPDPNTFRWLAGNVRLNHLQNVHVNQMALSDQAGRKRFYFAMPHDIGSNSLSRPVNDSGHFCEVTCTTVDEYVEANQLDKVHLIKVDIEGAEFAMFTGAKRLLSRQNKPIIVVEFEEERQRAFGNSCAKLAELLTADGYSLFRLDTVPLQAYAPRANDAPSFNVLAVPPGNTELLADLQRTPLREYAPVSIER